MSALQLERKLATERAEETRYELEQERLRMSEATMAQSFCLGPQVVSKPS